MKLDDVVEIIDFLQRNSISLWIDGGWGVDALLGVQTRTHGDLDIAVQHRDVPRLRVLLESRGYREVRRSDSKDWNFVLGDDRDHEVDVHSFTFDARGKHVYGTAYSAEALTGTGWIGAREVRCISAEWVARSRIGYELRETDIQDVEALHRKFGVQVPKEHDEWRKRQRS